MKRALLAGLVLASVFCLYLPALRAGFVDFDDPETVVDNVHVRGLSLEHVRWMVTTFHMGHYQPLSWLTLGLDAVWGRAVFGPTVAPDPRPYHVTNNLLHAGSAALVYLLALTLLPLAIRPKCTGWSLHAAAGVAALLFAAHPLRVESVAWITERRDVLSSFLLLASVLCYLAAQHGTLAARRWRMGAALAAFVLSLLGRSIGVTLPLILLVLDVWPLGRLGRGPGGWFGPRARVVWLEKLPFAAAAAAAAVLAPLAQRSAGAAVELWMHGLVPRLAVAGYGLGFYLWKPFWPTHLSPIYELRTPVEWTRFKYVASAAGVVAVLALLPLLARRRPGIATALTCYGLLLLPVLGLVQSGSQEVADRYSYLPGAVLAILIAGGAWSLWLRGSAPARMALGAAAAVVVIALSALTHRQLAVWHDAAALWTHAVRVQPDSSMIQTNYGHLLMERGERDGAIAHLRRAVALNPQHAQAHYNLWDAVRRGKNENERVAAYRDSIRIVREDLKTRWLPSRALAGKKVRSPVLQRAHAALGIALTARGRYDEAIEQFSLSLEEQPDHPVALGGLGVALLHKGQPVEAAAVLQRAILAAPAVANHRYNLAVALVRTGQLAAARSHLEAALHLDPANAEARNLLQALARSGSPAR